MLCSDYHIYEIQDSVSKFITVYSG